MTLTLELSPDVERALEEKAQRAGLALDAYLLDLARRDLQSADDSAADKADDLDAELDALARQFPTDAPPLADDAVARAYEEREAAQL